MWEMRLVMALLYNASLLLSLVVLFDIAARHFSQRGSLLQQLLLGAVLGGIGIAIMITPYSLSEGIVFDTRRFCSRWLRRPVFWGSADTGGHGFDGDLPLYAR